MKYELLGDSDCPLLKVDLKQNEKIRVENGAMVYMKDVELEGKMNSKGGGVGGFFKAIARSVTSGESMFITEAHGTSDEGEIGIAPSIPGKIARLKVSGKKQYCLNTGAFLACDESVNYNMVRQSASRAVFGGTGGFFVMETEGDGDMMVNAFGDLVELEVTNAKPLSIDNEHVVAWDRNLNYDIEVASGTFGFTSGEGLVNKFTGNGKVLIQTRNIESLAEAVKPFLPDKTNS